MRPRARWALWLGAGVALRVRALPPTVGDVDGVNFARALVAFDPAHQAPHFPGYAPYVAVTQLLSSLGAPEIWALALPGLLLWVLGALALATGLARHFGARRAELTLVALALLPGAVLWGAWPTSDGFGLGLGLLTLGLVAHAAPGRDGPGPRGAAYAAAIAAGLLFATRITWWPLFLVGGAVALRRPGRARRAALVAAAVAATTAVGPLLWALGPSGLVELALGFTAGHFSSWGGTAHAAADLPTRLGQMAWGAWSALGGNWTPAAGAVAALCTVATGLAAWGLVRSRPASPPRGVVLGALGLAAYLGWVLLGQNTEKPRHLLPLVPAIAVGLGFGLVRIAPRSAAPAWGLALALGLVTAPRAFEQARLPPSAGLVQSVLQRFPPAGVQIFAGEEARVFEHLAPQYRVWRPASAEVLVREARRAAAHGATVLVTSGAPGLAALAPDLEEIAQRQTPRAVRAHDARLVLYRLRPVNQENLHAKR